MQGHASRRWGADHGGEDRGDERWKHCAWTAEWQGAKGTRAVKQAWHSILSMCSGVSGWGWWALARKHVLTKSAVAKRCQHDRNKSGRNERAERNEARTSLSFLASNFSPPPLKFLRPDRQVYVMRPRRRLGGGDDIASTGRLDDDAATRTTMGTHSLTLTHSLTHTPRYGATPERGLVFGGAGLSVCPSPPGNEWSNTYSEQR